MRGGELVGERLGTGRKYAGRWFQVLGGTAAVLVFVGVFYFLLIRPQQKRMKEQQAMLSKLDKGDEVDADCGLRGEDFMRGCEERIGAALALGGQRLDVADGAAESEGLRAFGGAEIGVARAESETVGVANDGTDDDFCS